MANQPILARPLNCLALFLVLCLAPLCFGESVIVQVLGKDGQPIPNQDVTFGFRHEKLSPPVVRTERTDRNGEARIVLPQLKPKTLDVEVNFTLSDMRCSCRAHADTETVLREGLQIVSRSRGFRSPAPDHPTPGHIVFVARPASHSETILSSRQSTLLETILFGE